MPRLIITLVIIIASTLPAFALTPEGARTPALSPDGSRIAFSWRGDLWVASSDGGHAGRLTVHEAYDGYPCWSPDGSEIAFSSNRHGNHDIFVVDADGGTPERLTFHSDGDRIFDWSPDGDAIYFGSRRESRQDLLYRVPREGGRPVRVIDDLAWGATISPDGQWIAYLRGYTNWWRRGYRGPASRDIWIRHVDGGPSFHLVAWPGDDDHPYWSADGKSLLFQSEREDGVKNLWRQDLSFGDDRVDADGPPRQLSFLKNDGMQWLNISRDGRLAAFESEGKLWTMTTDGAQPQLLAVNCPGDLKSNAMTHRNLTRGASEFAFSPGEKQLAFVVEGEIYCGLIKDDELQDPVRLTETEAREKDLAWLDEDTLIFVSDRHGNDDIFSMHSSDEEESRLGRSRYREVVRLTDDPATENGPQLSPDGESLLYRKGTGFPWVMNGEGGEQRLLVDVPKVLHVDWSPDSRYLAFSVTNHGSAEDIFVVDLEDATGEALNISNHPNDDFHPLWTEDGKRLAWASRTNDGFYHLKYIWLTEAEADKSSREREREEEAEDDPPADDDGEDDEDDDEEEEPPITVTIDLEDLPDRIRTVATLRGSYWDYDQSPDGEHYALRSAMVENQMDLWTVDWDGDNLRRVTKGGANPDRMIWSEDSEKIRYLGGGQIREVANESGASPSSFGFSVPITVDARQRRLQKYAEAWRLLDDGFYDENFHGVDWPAIRAKYEGLAAEAVMFEDFKDVLRSMIGELNASHLGTWGGPGDSNGNDRTGLLGFTPDDDYAGPGLLVARVLDRGPLDREGRRVAPGDLILAIDGHEIAPGENHYPLLEHKIGEEVDLLVSTDGEERTITVEPRSSVWWQAYRQWMDENRSLVDALSGGRLGYLHMSAMGNGNWDTFLADIFHYARDKEGLIMDIRFNNGGSIHDRVLTYLSRKPYGYTKSRGKRSGNFDAQNRWDGPIVLLTNERSYSDGEIFPWGFKALGLGRVVGMPTFGAVIGTSNTTLIDGTAFRIPGSGWWRRGADGGIGDNLENIPVQPDILVPDVPEEALAGRDAQVEAGVAECLRMLTESRDR